MHIFENLDILATRRVNSTWFHLLVHSIFLYVSFHWKSNLGQELGFVLRIFVISASPVPFVISLSDTWLWALSVPVVPGLYWEPALPAEMNYLFIFPLLGLALGQGSPTSMGNLVETLKTSTLQSTLVDLIDAAGLTEVLSQGGKEFVISSPLTPPHD